MYTVCASSVSCKWFSCQTAVPDHCLSFYFKPKTLHMHLGLVSIPMCDEINNCKSCPQKKDLTYLVRFLIFDVSPWETEIRHPFKQMRLKP